MTSFLITQGEIHSLPDEWQPHLRRLLDRAVLAIDSNRCAHLRIPASEAFQIATNKSTPVTEVLIIWLLLDRLMEAKGLDDDLAEIDQVIWVCVANNHPENEQLFVAGVPVPKLKPGFQQRALQRLLQLESEGRL